jgi:membrane dipeptidase
MAKPDPRGSDLAKAVHVACPPFDLHDDVLMWARWAGYDISKRHEPPLPKSKWVGHADLPRFREGGIGAQFFGLVSLPVLGESGCYRAVNEQIDILDGYAASLPREIRKAVSVEDAEQARFDGYLAAFLGIEGAHALEGDIRNVAHFARRGVRYLGLSHFSANRACYPAKGKGARPDAGLTPFGREVVEACLANGVIVDLAHINRPGFMEAAAICRVYKTPVIVSHTGVLGAYKHWRNIDDDQLRAVASSGGVVGVIFVPNYLGGPGIDAVMRHMTHVIDTVGEDHVALGSDYDGMVTPTVGLEDVSRLGALTDAMLAAKWSVTRIAKVLRGNVLRVLKDAPPKHLVRNEESTDAEK